MKFFVTLLFSMLMKFSVAEVYLEKPVPGAVQTLNSVKPPGKTQLINHFIIAAAA